MTTRHLHPVPPPPDDDTTVAEYRNGAAQMLAWLADDFMALVPDEHVRPVHDAISAVLVRVREPKEGRRRTKK